MTLYCYLYRSNTLRVLFGDYNTHHVYGKNNINKFSGNDGFCTVIDSYTLVVYLELTTHIFLENQVCSPVEMISMCSITFTKISVAKIMIQSYVDIIADRKLSEYIRTEQNRIILVLRK